METETPQPTFTKSLHNTSSVTVLRVPTCFTPAEAARFLSILNEGIVLGAEVPFMFLGMLQVEVPAVYGREFQDLQQKWILSNFDDPGNTAAFRIENETQELEFNVVIPRNAPTGSCNYGFVAMQIAMMPEATKVASGIADPTIQTPAAPNAECDPRLPWVDNPKVQEFLAKIQATVTADLADHGWVAVLKFADDSELAQIFGAWHTDTQDIHNSLLELRPTKNGWKTSTAWRLNPSATGEFDSKFQTNIEEGTYVFFKHSGRNRIILVEPGPVFQIDEQFIIKRTLTDPNASV